MLQQISEDLMKPFFCWHGQSLLLQRGNSPAEESNKLNGNVRLSIWEFENFEGLFPSTVQHYDHQYQRPNLTCNSFAGHSQRQRVTIFLFHGHLHYRFARWEITPVFTDIFPAANKWNLWIYLLLCSEPGTPQFLCIFMPFFFPLTCSLLVSCSTLCLPMYLLIKSFNLLYCKRAF